MRIFSVPKWLIALALAFACAVGASRSGHAQTSVAFTDGSQALNQGWRTHAGDNPAWALPGFDDSAWPAISLAAPNDFAGWRWYRLRVQIPAQHPPLALLVTGGVGTYQVYVNGQRLPGPRVRSAAFVTYAQTRVVLLPGVEGIAVIALRTDVPATSLFLADRGAWRVELGAASAIRMAHQAAQSVLINSDVLGLGVSLMMILAGLGSLGLFCLHRDHREYFWLGIYLVAVATAACSFILVSTGFLFLSLHWFIGEPCGYVLTIALIEFTFSFVGQPVNRAWRVYEVLLAIPPFFLVLPVWLGLLSRGALNVIEVSLIAPAGIAMSILLLIWYRRGYREAGWLIVPSLLTMSGIVLTDLGIVGAYLGWPRLAAVARYLRIGVFDLAPFDFAGLLFLLAIAVVMFFRFTRVSRDQARAAAELEAAQRVQALLLRSAPSAQAGLRIDSVYRPAQEVGGDFFHTAQIDGLARVVVGDVSGKGLAAAMLVSVIVGALDTLRCTAPAEMLRALNGLLLSRQQDGFATCLCATVGADGAVTLANAGHLPPYRNGEELPLPPALPLGVSPEMEYSETSLRLAPGDMLTFLSDGVVEARNAAGELFGFERTRSLSTQSAEAIARAAQAHGQSDDITVLTLTFAPAEVLHA